MPDNDSTMKTGLLSAAILWCLIMIVMLVYHSRIVEPFGLTFLIYYLLVFAGIVLACTAMLKVKKAPFLTIATLLPCAIGLGLYFTVGFEWGRYALFQIERNQFEMQLKLANETGNIPDDEGVTDEGPPIRFAFYWQRGVTDNWVGAVYDSDGTMEEINKAKEWDKIYDHPLSELFGGTFYRCEDVGGGWYLCWFT